MTLDHVDRLERWLVTVLRWGARTSTVLLASGLLLELAGIAHGPALLLTRVGLIVLMATPVARVVVSVFEYTLERDWLFTALTATVLIILIGSVIVAVR